MKANKTSDEWFEEERSRLWALAYRMLGTVSETEDVLQDAYVKVIEVNLSEMDRPPAYLTTVVSRLCIDRLRRRDKDAYIGPWLPEPIAEDDASRFGAIHTAFLHLLENLNPKERAVFILKEAFDYDHHEVGEVLDISDASSRQLLKRAKQRLSTLEEYDLKPDPRPVVNQFVEALIADDLDRVETLLCDDVIAYTDGGGIVSAAIIPLEGTDRIKTVFGHLFRKFRGTATFSWQTVSGGWGLVVDNGDGTMSVATFVLKEGKLHRVYMMRNPEKLTAFI